MKRACVTLDAIRQTRLKNMHSRGMERKAHMDAYGKESKEGKIDLINGRLEYMMETASRTAGLTEKQYREWRKAERLEPLKRNGRGETPQREGREESRQGERWQEKRARKD